MRNCKIERDGENCWSVWMVCDCCDNGWHWIMTSMGPDAEADAKRWMEGLLNNTEMMKM